MGNFGQIISFLACTADGSAYLVGILHMIKIIIIMNIKCYISYYQYCVQNTFNIQYKIVLICWWCYAASDHLIFNLSTNELILESVNMDNKL
jgi:hypothetical protein